MRGRGAWASLLLCVVSEMLGANGAKGGRLDCEEAPLRRSSLPFFIVWEEHFETQHELSILAAKEAFATRPDAEDALHLLVEVRELLGRPMPSYCIREAATAEDAVLEVARLHFSRRSA